MDTRKTLQRHEACCPACHQHVRHPPSVWRFTCEREELSLDIGGCGTGPWPGVVSYTTIGLSDYDVVTGRSRPPAWSWPPPARGSAACFPISWPRRRCCSSRPAEGSQAGRCHSRRGCRVLSPRQRIASLSYPPFLWGQRLSRCAARRRTSPGSWPSRSPATSCSTCETQGGDGLEQLYRQRRIDMYSLGRATWLG